VAEINRGPYCAKGVNAKLKSELAVLWQKILRASPKKLFGSGASAIRDHNVDDWIAQPGYVGSQYRVGGLIFVAANPGGRTQDDLGATDTKQYKLLTQLRSAGTRSRAGAFDELNRDLAVSMKTWGIYDMYVARILDGLPIRFSAVAFLNLVKWRTAGETMPRSLVGASWRAHTSDQLELLQPSLIISLGKSVTGPFIDGHYDSAHNITIPRTRGDRRLSADSKAGIKSAREYLHHWRPKQQQ
jgi:hypothetical protein